jgi:hypothetical protein
MKIATKIIFASALMLSVVAPTLSNAAYFVDQTKIWATNTREQNVMEGKKVRVDRALDAMAYAPVDNGDFRDFGILSQH